MNVGLVCFEPLVKVTGGIGTYSRLLIDRLLVEGHSVSLFTKHSLVAEAMEQFSSANFNAYSVDESSDVPNNIFPHQLELSFGLYQSVLKFAANGGVLDFIECPDYEAPGFHLTNARRAGEALPPVFVRLHSPTFMLNDDNNVSNYDVSTLRLNSAERSAILHCDEVLYGNDAMLDRVLSYFPHEAKSIITVRKIAHPNSLVFSKTSTANAETPTSQVKKIGMIGRQEFRKGWDLIFRNSHVPWDKVEFHFFGADTSNYDGRSMRTSILEIIEPKNQGKLLFRGYLPQQELKLEIEGCDAYIFPSRFENFPNALLEVQHLGKPIAASTNGGMPELLESYDNKYIFDPYMDFDWAKFLGLPRHSWQAPKKIDWYEGYENLIGGIERAALLSKTVAPITSFVSVVIPVGPDQTYLGEAIESALNSKYVLEVVLALDGVKLDEHISASLANKVRVLEFDKSGPGRLRLFASELAVGQVVQFLDADDLLVPETLEPVWQSIQADDELKIATSLFRAFDNEHYEWAPSPTSLALILLENFTHSGWCARKEVFSKISRSLDYRAAHDEDWALMVELAYLGIQPLVTGKVGYLYRKQANSRTSTDMGFRFESEFLRKAFFSELANWHHLNVTDFKEIVFSRNTSAHFVSPSVNFIYGVLRKILGRTKMWPLVLRLGRAIVG